MSLESVKNIIFEMREEVDGVVLHRLVEQMKRENVRVVIVRAEKKGDNPATLTLEITGLDFTLPTW